MNDLKESNETIRQTMDEIKQQQDELKNIIDILNKEKNDWVLLLLFLN
jgi:FtsZ-binding cell division protein ZapB